MLFYPRMIGNVVEGDNNGQRFIERHFKGIHKTHKHTQEQEGGGQVHRGPNIIRDNNKANVQML